MASVPTGFNSAVGQQQFLDLLVSQLQYQNPLEPVKQQDFLSQLAQFSTLSGVEQLNTNFDDLVKLQSLTEGSSLIGKNVEYISATSGEHETGVVDSIRVVDNRLVGVINNVDVKASDILSVLADAPE